MLLLSSSITMEPQSNDQLPSPSGSEEMESDGDSEQEDEVENDRSRDSDNENQDDSDKENSDDSDDSDDEDDDDDDDDEEESDGEGEDSSENKDNVSNNDVRSENNDSPHKDAKDCNGSYNEVLEAKEPKLRMSSEMDYHPLDDLPLEVITTVEPTNYSYPVLKNMSNGVLTHRNIFTEHERAVLKDIINKYRNIVDTRSRTREIYLEKQSVWQQIVEEYNSTENIMVRTEKELRKCWDNMKYRAKQAEKEMFKIEKYDSSYDGMDIQSLTRQAIEEVVKMQEGPVKPEHQDMDVKMEPMEGSPGPDEDDGDSNPEHPDGDTGIPADEDREPALKRARQESPKLSSLLLAASNKHSSSKKNGKTNLKKGSNKFPFSIPECTKVVPIKRKNSQMNSASVAGLNASAANLPVSILPKGLGACLSITNIPNPITTAVNHTNTNYSYQHKDASPPLLTSSLQSLMKPMPSLRKMVLGKHQSNGNSKNLVGRSSKKSNSHGVKEKLHSSNKSVTMNSGQSSNNIHDYENLFNDCDKNESPEKSLIMKLNSQRLEFERQEHELKMKLMEKELQSQTYQSQYWALRLKLLRSGRESHAFNVAGATNGDIG